MAKFEPGDARQWARTSLRGVAGCLLPTLTADMSGVNERAIRHDVRREIELGFRALLITDENGTSPDEIRDVIDIAVDEAKDDLVTIIHAAEDSKDANVELVSYAERAGVDLVLPAYPLMFYPRTEADVLAYTKAIADSTDLGVIVFAVHLWNFARLHPSEFSPELIGQIIDQCPNVVAIKAENGMPGVAGIGQVFERYREEVLISDPFEQNAPTWCKVYGMPFMGTSNYEYFGSGVPEYFEVLQDPESYEKAMELYWGLHTARKANGAVMSEATAGTNLVPRLIWKYQGWLNGFNGGPIRSPHARITDRQMATLRAGLLASGLPVTSDEDAEFFVGRHAG